jgi:hypothetical protein
MEKYELKKKYKELVRKGETLEADKVLNLIRNFNDSNSYKEEVIEVSKKKVQEKVEFETIDNLLKINGVGPKNIKDIKRMTNSIDGLKKLIQDDLLPLRDDIVIKLKERLKL